MAEQKITLVSSDGDKLEYTKSVCEKSILLKKKIEENGVEKDIEVEIVTKELKTVMSFCEYIVINDNFPVIKFPIKNNDFSECLKEHEWFCEFVNKFDNDEMFAVGLAADFLDCSDLVDLISCKVATLVMGKTVAE